MAKRITTPTEAPPTPAVTPVLVRVKPPNFQTNLFRIKGTAPLVICRFSEESRRMMEEKQALGDQPSAGKKVRPPKDFEKLYVQARHIAKEGWDGVHAGAFRNGMISACRLTVMQMSKAKLAIFVEPDGWDD